MRKTIDLSAYSIHRPKKYYDYRNSWNLIKTTNIVIFSITSDQVLPITATWLAVSSHNRYKTPYKTLGTKRRKQEWEDLARLLLIYLIPKMLLGETKKEYFGRNVKCICWIYVFICINCDETWQGSYKNPVDLLDC